jgi:hypothetical protein
MRIRNQWQGSQRLIRKFLACQMNVGGLIHVSYMGSETLLFIVALFNNSHNERSKHYE